MFMFVPTPTEGDWYINPSHVSMVSPAPECFHEDVRCQITLSNGEVVLGSWTPAEAVAQIRMNRP